MSTTPRQRLALSICDFLTRSLTDGSLTAEDKDSVEIAINCISESFRVDPSSATPPSPSLLDLFTAAEASSPPTPAPAAAAASIDSAAVPTDAEKKEAEGLKSRGNAAMAAKDYPRAIDLYTQALALHPRNAIFLSNRAAAHSAAKDHASAKVDAEAAVAIDPSYTKAWSRLGLANFALGDPRASMEAYKKGIEHEGNGGSEAMRKGFETAKRRVEELDGAGSAGDDLTERARGAGAGAGAGAGGMPDLSSLAGMFGGGGAGGAGGPGGMDFASILNNPMFQNMAQSLMSNPDMMSNLMNNPRLREMANQVGSGGGMPDLSAMMSDPTIAEMARSMMGGGGAGGAGGASGAGNQGRDNN